MVLFFLSNGSSFNLINLFIDKLLGTNSMNYLGNIGTYSNLKNYAMFNKNIKNSSFSLSISKNKKLPKYNSFNNTLSDTLVSKYSGFLYLNKERKIFNFLVSDIYNMFYTNSDLKSNSKISADGSISLRALSYHFLKKMNKPGSLLFREVLFFKYKYLKNININNRL